MWSLYVLEPILISHYDVGIKLHSPTMNPIHGRRWRNSHLSTPLLEDYWCPCTIFSCYPSGGTHVPFQIKMTKAKAKLCTQTHLWLETFSTIINHSTFYCSGSGGLNYFTEQKTLEWLFYALLLHSITWLYFSTSTRKAVWEIFPNSQYSENGRQN